MAASTCHLRLGNQNQHRLPWASRRVIDLNACLLVADQQQLLRRFTLISFLPILIEIATAPAETTLVVPLPITDSLRLITNAHLWVAEARRSFRHTTNKPLNQQKSPPHDGPFVNT